MPLSRLILILAASSLLLSACDDSSTRRKNPSRRAAAVGKKPLANKTNLIPQKSSNTTNATPTTTEENPTDSQGLKPTSAGAKPSTNTTQQTPGDLEVADPSVDGNSANSSSQAQGRSSLVAPGVKSDNTVHGPHEAKLSLETNITKDPKAPEELHVTELQTLLARMSPIYRDSWMMMVKDKYSKPRNFFEEVSSKMKLYNPTLTLDEGVAVPASIYTQCNRFRFVDYKSKTSDAHSLRLFDCSEKKFTLFQLNYRSRNSDWVIQTNTASLDEMLPQQLSFLQTISIKPYCRITTAGQGSDLYITKASCNDWGQVLSAAKLQDQKTVHIKSILFDRSGTNLYETQGWYLDYDKSYQLCRIGPLKRVAPQSPDKIYIDDEGDGSCVPEAQPTQPPIPGNSLAAKPAEQATPAQQAIPPIVGRARLVPTANPAINGSGTLNEATPQFNGDQYSDVGTIPTNEAEAAATNSTNDLQSPETVLPIKNDNVGPTPSDGTAKPNEESGQQDQAPAPTESYFQNGADFSSSSEPNFQNQKTQGVEQYPSGKLNRGESL